KYYLLKQQNFNEIERNLLNIANSQNFKISCKKKCDYCCIAYLIGPEIEIELINYFINNTEYLKKKIIKNIKKWLDKILKFENLINQIKEIIPIIGCGAPSIEEVRKYYSLANEYLKLKIKCPFLENNICLLYPVRPFVCANICSITAPKLCKNLAADRKILKSSIPPVVIAINNKIVFYPIVEKIFEKIN
ncbi:MAG TPA: hypothetical protein PLJ38_04215, partial [bacterium]|nr:hypothetical protein [bacterium]